MSENVKKCSCGKYNDGISCDVRNCVYHVGDCHCTATKISVGPSSANTSADTICATFKQKEN
ncbi:MAG: DUF1540 domain-containing protein [Clostridia bacterium]|nr:DUF1540 domain-containing protein [Clostridia bacterium]